MGESERLRSQLQRLPLHTMAQIFEEEAVKAAKTEMTYTAFLARLADEELAAKLDRSVNVRIHKARLPVLRTLEGFDFACQPYLSAARVRELGELGFLERAENILFVGQRGVGKTHLSLGLALQACQARKRMLFFQATELLDDLLAAEPSHDLHKRIETLGRLDLLVVDELGHLPMDARRANLFFQLVNHLYTRAFIILTTNVAFEGWGKVFGDNVIASAILDRLLHYSDVFPITGPSYRMKGKLTRSLDDGQQVSHDMGQSPLPGLVRFQAETWVKFQTESTCFRAFQARRAAYHGHLRPRSSLLRRQPHLWPFPLARLAQSGKGVYDRYIKHTLVCQ